MSVASVVSESVVVVVVAVVVVRGSSVRCGGSDPPDRVLAPGETSPSGSAGLSSYCGWCSSASGAACTGLAGLGASCIPESSSSLYIDVHRRMRCVSKVRILGGGPGSDRRRGLFGRLEVVSEVLSFVLDCGAHMLRCESQK